MKNVLTVLIVLLISQIVFTQTKIDEYGRLISDDEANRLFAVSEEFSKNKDSKIYILIHKEKKMPLGRFLRYFYGVEVFLNRLEIPKESIVTLAGEEKEAQLTQIWLIKKRENPPIFNEVSIEERLKEKLSKKILFDTNCIDCDESPFIKLSMFREGLGYLAKVLLANPYFQLIAEIQSPNYYSKREKYLQRKELSKFIIDGLKKHKIPRNRISIQFTLGMEAKFYLIPNLKQK